MNKKLFQSIKKGILYLTREQQKDGSFLSYSTSDPDNFKKAIVYKSVFPAALILSALAGLKEDKGLEKIKSKSAVFLLAQKSPNWSFNYWAKGTEESQKMPYPDDLDDTFCALSALYLYDKSLITPEAMSNIVGILTFLEEKEGGPYRTWLVGKEAKGPWKDVDLAVNSNVAYFLKLNEIILPGLENFIEEQILSGKYASPYYPSPLPIIYFISRFYAGKYKQAIIEYLLKKERPKGGWGNPLDTALAVNALFNLGVGSERLSKSLNYLLKTQKRGGWPAGAFCLDPALNKKKYYAGSRALTTAFCLEALSQYLNKSNQVLESSKSISAGVLNDKKAQKIYRGILNLIQGRLKELPPDFKKLAAEALQISIDSKNGLEILLLPHFFRESLIGSGSKIKDEFVIKLGLANLYGWAAYTIYDDFLDDEGDKHLLPVANLCLRELTAIFENMNGPGGASIKKVFHDLMDRMEAANNWEVVNCRSENLPKYDDVSKLSDRSLPHALGPLAILLASGFKEKSKEVRALADFFRFYLAAKQLDDEAHDWEDDFGKGHMTSVVVRVLESSGSEKSLEKIRELFWKDTVKEVAQEILELSNRARGTFGPLKNVVKIELLSEIIKKIENSAHKTLKEQQEILAFLASYGNVL